MKCPQCGCDLKTALKRSKVSTRRAIEDRDIDKDLGIDDDSGAALGADELGGMRGAMPGVRLNGYGPGSDDWNEAELYGSGDR